MRRHSIITDDDVLRAVRIFRWVTRFILVLFFGAGERRIKALEKLLPALEREGRIFSEWYRGEKVYSIARKKKGKPVSIAHEIACALVLVLLWRCRMAESEIVPERAFRGFGIVPEAGIRYSEDRQTMIVIEFESWKDYKRAVKGKITRYIKYLPQMEAKFGRRITVLFVLEIERGEARRFVSRVVKAFDGVDFSGNDGSLDGMSAPSPTANTSASYEGDTFPLDPFFFTDYRTFKSVPVGEALTSKIYFWNDGKEWSLGDHD